MTTDPADHVRIERVRLWRVYWGGQLVGAAPSREEAEKMAESVRDITDHQPPPKKVRKVTAKKGAVSKAAKKRMAKTLKPKPKPVRGTK